MGESGKGKSLMMVGRKENLLNSNIEEFPSLILWHSGLSLQRCHYIVSDHCYDMSSIPGQGTCTCCRLRQKKKSNIAPRSWYLFILTEETVDGIGLVVQASGNPLNHLLKVHVSEADPAVPHSVFPDERRHASMRIQNHC